MRIKHRRYRVYPPYGLGYCGGARPRGPLNIQRRPTGIRRLLHWVHRRYQTQQDFYSDL